MMSKNKENFSGLSDSMKESLTRKGESHYVQGWFQGMVVSGIYHSLKGLNLPEDILVPMVLDMYKFHSLQTSQEELAKLHLKLQHLQDPESIMN